MLYIITKSPQSLISLHYQQVTRNKDRAQRRWIYASLISLKYISAVFSAITLAQALIIQGSHNWPLIVKGSSSTQLLLLFLQGKSHSVTPLPLQWPSKKVLPPQLDRKVPQTTTCLSTSYLIIYLVAAITIPLSPLTQCLLCARYFAKTFTFSTSFNPHNSTGQKVSSPSFQR